MAIVVTAYTVVVPVRTLEALWPGGEAAYRDAAPNGTYRSDGQLTGISLLSPQEVRGWCEETLLSCGIRYLRDGHAVDVAVVDQTTGPLVPCSWLEFERKPAWSEASLVGTPATALAPPRGWAPDEEPLQLTTNEEVAEHFEFEGVENHVAVFRDERSGEERCVGLTTDDGLSEAFAARLGVLQDRLGEIREVADVTDPDELPAEMRDALESIANEATRILKCSPGNTSSALFMAGLALRTRGDYERAVPVWEAFTEREGHFAGGWMELTWCYAATERKEQALGAARKALELAPEDAGAMANLGGALHALGHRDEALAWTEKALLARPDDPITWQLKRSIESGKPE